VGAGSGFKYPFSPLFSADFDLQFSAVAGREKIEIGRKNLEIATSAFTTGKCLYNCILLRKMTCKMQAKMRSAFCKCRAKCLEAFVNAIKF